MVTFQEYLQEQNSSVKNINAYYDLNQELRNKKLLNTPEPEPLVPPTVQRAFSTNVDGIGIIQRNDGFRIVDKTYKPLANGKVFTKYKDAVMAVTKREY